VPRLVGSVLMGSGLAAAQRPAMTRNFRRHSSRGAAFAAAILGSALLLAGCHGSTLDAVYPGSFGHEPPPAVNLPPQDSGLERL
jgi:hypothetical protein